jgi:hypothetical protein
VTWHRLADHPLPEPREGQVLLIDCPNAAQLMFRSHYRLDIKAWGGASGWLLPDELQHECLRDHPNAQWYLVPAPDELRSRLIELEEPDSKREPF